MNTESIPHPTDRRFSEFLEQAVNGTLRFETLVTLLGYASEPHCRYVRYVMPNPDRFGLFIEEPNPPAPPPHLWKPTELTLNELCAASHVVVRKIADWHNQKEKAARDAAHYRGLSELS